MELDKVGIDLGKTVFHLVALNRAGETVVRKKFSRSQLLRFTANLQVRMIGMEACGGAHYLARTLCGQGHDVRLMPAQYVKPFVKTNKNDYIDAEAIAEALDRPRMRYVPIKSNDQLDMQSLHRVRSRWVKSRTSLVNQIRGLLLERGITIRKGRRHAEATLPAVLEDAEINLSGTLRFILAQLLSELRQLNSQITDIDETIQRGADEQEACQRLMAIPGVGPTQRQPSSQRSATVRSFARPGVSLPGSVWYRESIRRVGSRSFSGSASVEACIYANCWCMAHERFCSVAKSNLLV